MRAPKLRRQRFEIFGVAVALMKADQAEPARASSDPPSILCPLALLADRNSAGVPADNAGVADAAICRGRRRRLMGPRVGSRCRVHRNRVGRYRRAKATQRIGLPFHINANSVLQVGREGLLRSV